MKIKLLSRFLCALLSVLMLVCMVPAVTVSAARESQTVDSNYKYIEDIYADADERLADMSMYYNDGAYSLWCDEVLGTVAYRNEKTGEVLFTNPIDTSLYKNSSDDVRSEIMSQIVLKYIDSSTRDVTKSKTLYSYKDAALKAQITIKSIKNGLRVEYAIGERSARTLLPQQIERVAFEDKILKPMYEALGGTSKDYLEFKSYYNEMFYVQNLYEGKTDYAKGVADEYPITAEKNIDIYVLQNDITERKKREFEAMILAYCPDYTFEEMDNDHDYVGYEEESVSPPVFKVALEYTIDENGLVVNLPANGLRYDETSYRITELIVLPYMGASNKDNEGYSFIPDGSGSLYSLGTTASYSSRVYGKDFSLFDFEVSNMAEHQSQIARMPVFGQVEKIVDEETGTTESRGYLAIIESGDAMASISTNHLSYLQHASVKPTFVTRQFDVTDSGWTVYASRRYVEDYTIRYIMLTDDAKAEAADLSSYYECSWMGMAFAYRDYLSATQDGYQRLTDEDVEDSIPLYLETFGCLDTVEKVLSMPVTVSVALTSFEDIVTMYDYLAGEGVTNVNFKMTGYANGGLYSEMPYKLKWENSVGGSSGFEDLTAYAAEKGFGLYPDFDFVYTTQSDGGNHINMKKNAARTIDNRYTSRRVYSATKQSLVSYYQMVMSPDTYSKFYEKLGAKYAKYENATGISLASLGNSLNSDYDEDKTILREEAKEYVIGAISYFKDQDYDVMLDSGNAFTWNYADHILNVPLDSSRYTTEMQSIPFMGVVLHGYVEFAGTAVNLEGNLSYAMLKAIENGASIYFVLSYANTELLKEDVLLSQNYSVRYDIWQSRLVEIYDELNAVLADVQTKLIIGHQTLESSRVPDADELLRDIEAVAQGQIEKIEELLDKEHDDAIAAKRQARIAAEQANSKIAEYVKTNYVTLIDNERASKDPSYLVEYWNSLVEAKKTVDGPSATLVGNFETTLKSQVISRLTGMRQNVADATERLLAAKNGHAHLVAVQADEVLISDAADNLEEAKTNYLILMTQYEGKTATAFDEDAFQAAQTADAIKQSVVYSGTAVTVEDMTVEDLTAFILGTDANDLQLGAEELYKAFENLLVAQGIAKGVNGNVAEGDGTDEAVVPLIDMAKLFAETTGESTTGGEDGESGDTAGDESDDAQGDESEDDSQDDADGEEGEENVIIIPEPPTDEYAVDSDIVVVTYGEVGVPYKSVILNFNDYSVQTTYNGVTYTIEGYGYVVIYH